MTGRIVGIDLGTTNSEVAALTNEGVLVLEEDGNALFPSVVGLAPDGQLLVGEEALRQAVLHPDRTIRSVKRRMGTNEEIRLGDQTFRPQEISALILGALRQRAERVLGEPVVGAVITVPAYFSDAQRQATREAGEIAGLRVERILNEPTAASLAYPASSGDEASLHGGGARTTLVYDLGGGTFDVSIVRQEADVTEVLASHGDVHLGGDDLDLVLANRVLDDLGDAFLRARFEADPSVRARVLRAAEAVRCRLSEAPHARIREDSVCIEDAVAHHVDREIEQTDLDAWIAPLLERTLVSVHRALEDARLTPKDLDDVLLAGGATRTPAVQALLAEATGRLPSTVLHPDTCVALGAGLVAARVEGRSEAAVLVDVTPYTFGTSVLDWSGPVPNFHKFHPIIQRNSPLPQSVTHSFGTTIDGQPKARVEVLQGEDEDARNNLRIGDFLVEGLADVASGNEITIGLNLGLDGILEVTATERKTGLSRRVVVEGALGRLGERELGAARERVADLLGRDDDSAEAPASVIEVQVVTDARVPEDVEPEYRDVLLRLGRLLPRMAPEDREEAEKLRASLLDLPKDVDGDEIRLRLEDLLFYVGESDA